MKQSQSSGTPKLESDLDQLRQELHQLVSHVTLQDKHQQREESESGQGHFPIAGGRS